MSPEPTEVPAFDSPGGALGANWYAERRKLEFTIGDWATEAESAAAFDEAVPTDLFKVHREVRGTLLSPRPAQTDRSMRIDRILLPTDHLISLGWKFGIIGCEIKKSGAKIGPAIAQATDYSRTAWQLGPYRVLTDYTFIWPMAGQGSTIASILAQNCIGSANANSYTRFQLKCGEVPILHVAPDPHGSVRVGTKGCGARAGSR